MAKQALTHNVYGGFGLVIGFKSYYTPDTYVENPLFVSVKSGDLEIDIMVDASIVISYGDKAYSPPKAFSEDGTFYEVGFIVKGNRLYYTDGVNNFVELDLGSKAVGDTITIEIEDDYINELESIYLYQSEPAEVSIDTNLYKRIF